MQTYSHIDPEVSSRWLLVPGDWRRPTVDESYEILWDESVSYGQIWPRPTVDEAASFYAIEAYYTHEAGAGASGSARSFAQRLQTKMSWLGDKGVEATESWWAELIGARKMRILEVGCGNGTTLKHLAAIGHDVVGVEPDPKARAVARDAGLTVYDGTGEQLPDEILDTEFDLIIFLHVLEHCIDPEDAVRNAATLLVQGGTLVAEVPNNACKGALRYGVVWHWLDAPRHLNFFTDKSLAGLCRSVGLRVDDVLFTGYCRQFSADWKDVQALIHDRLKVASQPRPTALGYWLYLFSTLWARPAVKYDSVRVVCRRDAKG